MAKNKEYNRTTTLINRYAEFIKSIDTDNIETNITIDKLIELKSALSDINNVMTLLATRSVATKLASILCMDDINKRKLFQVIDNQKPNTNGFDIRIDTPSKILVEVKCNSLIHNKKFGAAQLNAILDDARKLRLESPRNKKAIQNIQDTKDYIKIVVIVNVSSKPDENLISQITRETKCKESTNSARKERMEVKRFLRPLDSLSQIRKITEKDNVYITALSKNDLKEELEHIRSEYFSTQ